jgi:hypothetical protein
MKKKIFGTTIEKGCWATFSSLRMNQGMSFGENLFGLTGAQSEAVYRNKLQTSNKFKQNNYGFLYIKGLSFVPQIETDT